MGISQNRGTPFLLQIEQNFLKGTPQRVHLFSETPVWLGVVGRTSRLIVHCSTEMYALNISAS